MSLNKHGRVESIPRDHDKVHTEQFFTLSDFDPDVDVGSPKYWHVATPDSDIRFHVKINLESDTGGLLEFFENPTTGSRGTELTCFNNDRNSSNACSILFYKDPTVSADGTRLQVARIGAGRDKKLGGVAKSDSEWILKKNEQYLIKVTPDANDAEVTITFEGYEAPKFED